MDGWIKTLDRAAKAFATELGGRFGSLMGIGLAVYVLSFLGVDWSFLLAETPMPNWLIALAILIWLREVK